MNERSQQISKLRTDKKARAAYIRSKIATLVPAQIRALRLKSEMPRQSDLAREARMQQSRISKLESPGEANVTLETLSWLASVFKVGLVVKFAPFSEMLQWENTFEQDSFDVVRLDQDLKFTNEMLSSIALVTKQTERELFVPPTARIEVLPSGVMVGSSEIPSSTALETKRLEGEVFTPRAVHVEAFPSGVMVGSTATVKQFSMQGPVAPDRLLTHRRRSDYAVIGGN